MARDIHKTALISKKPIRKIEDFKGLKIRSSGAIASFLKDLGDSPEGVPPGSDLPWRRIESVAADEGVPDGADGSVMST